MRSASSRSTGPADSRPEADSAVVRKKQRGRLSVCMIVRDEAENLARALASVKDVADEIVVVDTGSVDNSVAVARSFGARIGHFTWCEDFAAARNVAVGMATSRWILSLDADEELLP